MTTWLTPDDELASILAELEAEGCDECGGDVEVKFFAKPYFHALVECVECWWSVEYDLSD